MAIIEYNGSVVATVEGGNTATLPVKDLNMKTDIVITVPEGEGGGIDSPLPIAVSTEAEMTALLTSGEIGGIYKYTGATGTYENGALYVLEEEEATDTVITAYFKKSSSSTPNIEIGYYDTEEYTTTKVATISATTATEITLTIPSGYGVYLSAGFGCTLWTILEDGVAVDWGDCVDPLYGCDVKNGKTYTIHAEED